LSSTASGGTFTGVTFTVTVAVSVPPRPSEMVYENVTTPLKFGAGVNVTPVAVKVTVPLAGWVTAVNVSVSPTSGANVSLASTSNVVAPLSSATVKLSSRASGGSFSSVTVTVTVAVAVPPLPSEIVYVNVVVPTKPAFGVKVTLEPVKD